jgi:hypothetical protein
MCFGFDIMQVFASGNDAGVAEVIQEGDPIDAAARAQLQWQVASGLSGDYPGRTSTG